MKKIGKEVLFLPASEKNPRNGEGAFIRLKDNTIMFAYTQYCGDNIDEWLDHSPARIAACYSKDEGETWSEPRVLFEKSDDECNIMSLSFVRMSNDEIGVLYLAKVKLSEKEHFCLPRFHYSSDEGKTWSEAINCLKDPRYYIVNNDRVIKLKSGRIMFPASDTGYCYPKLEAGRVKFVYSDDNGRSWDILPQTIESPYEDGVGLQEPGIYEFESGRLWAYFRTAYGHQYQSFSEDGGVSWTPAVPNFHFTSPDSPMLVKKVGKYTVSVFNPIGYNCLNERFDQCLSPKRTPYVCAVSTDGGESFDSTGKTAMYGKLGDFTAGCFLLEDDYSNSYCYPAVIEVDGGFLVAYYHSNGTGISLDSTKIIKVMYDEIDAKS